MSNRTQAFNAPSSNPATKFIDWKSRDKDFEYYDKEKQEKVKIPLPFKFLVLEELHTVKGWNDATESGIFSNEVKYISKEEMTVKPFKGNVIAKGLYKDIKVDVKAAGGHYTKSIYIVTTDGLLCNLQLKGSVVQAWGEFTQKTRTRLTDEWVTVKTAKQEKKGSVTYSVPEFLFDGFLSKAEVKKADAVFDVLENYLNTYLKREPVENIEVIDELEF